MTTPTHNPSASQADQVNRDAPALLKRDLGQATVEYALILLVAAVIALLVVTWATAGGGAGRIGGFFDSVINRIMSRAGDMF